ncbi:MAG: class C sortase [Ruminococcus sp.]|nr:class C sortase [Ruminococcus sp.]
MKKRLNTLTNIMLIVLLIVGLSVMLYPTVANWWNKNMTTRAVASYRETVDDLDDETAMKMIDEARLYNKQLAGLFAPFTNYNDVPGYYDILDVTGTGIMGYITISSVNLELPIYHGTSEGVLNVAAGHMQGSSLPVGGENTHSVISAHRGLPSARLFTDIDKMVVGDTFTVTVLDQVMTYEVEEILIVEPTEIDKLAIIPDSDYVTLMTCTPYGINTHRLLIRSHRIDTAYESAKVRVPSDAAQVDPMMVVPAIASPFVIALLVIWFSGKREEKSVADRFDIDPKYRL